MPTMEEFYKAIDDLFGFLTLETNFSIVIGKNEKECYARIGEFLSTPEQVFEAMRTIAKLMTELFVSNPEEYSHHPESNFLSRNLLQALKVKKDSDSKEEDRKNKLSNYKNRKIPENLQSPHPKVQEAINLGGALGLHHSNSPKGMFVESEGLVVRRFSFRKLLIALEAKFLGFVDNGLILTEDVAIAKYLRTCEVWKDSIGIQHGEYTHRLQWLAIAVHFGWDRSLLATLYKGSSATLKKAAYECFGAVSLLDFVKKRDEQKLDVPVNLWEFLFDSREMRGQVLPYWPKDTGDISSNKLQTYRYSHRSKNSCQSPAFMNKVLMSDASFGLIHAYLSASAIKLLDVGNLKSIALNRYQKNRQELKVPKFVLNQFETPLSPTSTASTLPLSSSNVNQGGDGKGEMN